MASQVDSLWLLAFFPQLSTISSQTLLFLFAFLSFISTFIAMHHWAHRGGPAWGKFYHHHPHHATRIPGPRGYPLVGSISLMTGLAHRKLAATAEALGAIRLMAFSLGQTRFLVTSEPNVAKEILNSPVFVDRPEKESAHRQMFGRAIGFAPHGVYWRTLRRIAAVHMFSPAQVAKGQERRAEIAAEVAAAIGGGGEVRQVLKRASLSNMMGSVFGRRYEAGTTWGEAAEVGRLVEEGYELLGMLNWSDHMPWLAWMDLQRIRVRCSNLVPRVNRFVGRVISERKEKGDSGMLRNLVDVLLSLQEEDQLSDSDMASVLWEMIFRGTDTVAAVIEWVLARMIIHPDIQSMVHEELDRVVGRSRPLMESDLPFLRYLHAVIKEVLRLHPPGPLLSWARLSVTDTTVDGHHVPAGTTAMVNMWAIARDPKVWAYPLNFSPDRFLSQNGKEMGFCIMGSDLRLAPFGSGRRSCPGKSLGLTTVTFWVGSLLHEFEFSGTGPDLIDLSEVLGLSSEMANPLKVTVRPRRG